MAWIRGTAVTLFEKRQTGEDAFGAPVYTQVPVRVENVLISPLSAQAAAQTEQLFARKAVYELHIPKGDAHAWEGCRVDFMGRSWRVCTPPLLWQEDEIPLRWKGKVQVERYEQ